MMTTENTLLGQVSPARSILFLALMCAIPLQAADVVLGSGISVEPDHSAVVALSLAAPAPPGGVYVSLDTADQAVAVVRPATVLIPEGATVPYSLPRVTGVNFGTTSITASAFGLSGDSQLIRVVTSLSGPGDLTLERGTSRSVTFSLPAPTPSTLTVLLSSSNPAAASVPASFVIPAGGSVGVVPISGNAAGSAVIKAGGPGFASDALVNVTVSAPGAITLPSSFSVNEGQTVTFPVSLSTPAPPQGVQITLESSDPARVGINPSSVFIFGGATTPSVQPRVSGLNIGGSVVTASAPGYGSASLPVVVPATLRFSPSSLNLSAPNQGSLLLVLSASAPWDIGLTVQLTSSNPSVASIQPTVNFYPDGSEFTSVVIVVTPHSPGTTTITAAAPPYIPAAVATVTVGGGSSGPATLISVVSGNLQSATVNTAFASPLSALVTDAVGNPVPGVNVTFTAPSSGPGGTFSGSSTIATNGAGIATSPALQANGTAGSFSVNASAAGIAQPATFNLTNTSGGSGAISLSSSVTTGPSQSVAFPVSLSVPAPGSGVMVALTSSDPSKATIAPASVFISPGATSPAVQPQVTGVNFGSANISATASGYSSASQAVLIKGVLSFSPATVNARGTGPQSLSLQLSAPAPASGLTVSLSSSNPGIATVPGSAAFTSGQTSISVPVTVTGFGSAIVSASSAAPNVTGGTATVNAQAGADISLGTGLVVEPGERTDLPLTLAAPAPVGGIYVTLTSSDTSVLDLNPKTVYIQEGLRTPLRLPQINAFRFGSAAVTATAPQLAGDTQTVSVATTLYGPTSATIERGTTSNITLSLPNAAPTAITLNLTSDNGGIASVPANVTIPAGSSVVFLPVTGTGAGNTTIHAGGNAFAGIRNIDVTVSSPSGITLPSGVSVKEGQSAPFPVALGSPAPPYGVSVTLMSSDPARVSVTPSLLFVPGGATLPDFQPQVRGLAIGGAVITASAPGYLAATQTVTVPATFTFVQNSLTIPLGSAPGKLFLALSASAPWDIGLTAELTSTNPAVATVLPTVQFYPDGSEFTTVVVIVTPQSRGTTLIKASAPPYIPETVATVTVQ